MKYKFLEHTADAKFRAYGKDLNECFKNAGLAMFSIMIDPKKVKPRITKKIYVKSNNMESLLYEYLDKLLFLLDAEFFLLHDVKDLKIKGNSLTAVIVGDKIDDAVELGSGVKAMTYSEMVIQNKKPFYVQVVVDL